jgi:hypothetical protein
MESMSRVVEAARTDGKREGVPEGLGMGNG